MSTFNIIIIIIIGIADKESYTQRVVSRAQPVLMFIKSLPVLGIVHKWISEFIKWVMNVNKWM